MEDLVFGKNPVLLRLESGLAVKQILLLNTIRRDDKIQAILDEAKRQHVRYSFVPKQQLEKFVEKTDTHQGVLAFVAPFKYSSIDDILAKAKQANEEALVLILDSIEDPHNLGAIIRTAVAAGVHGIIIPSRRAAQVNQTVIKVSAGMADECLIVKVGNLARTIDELKEKRFWIYALAGEATQSYDSPNYKGATAIILGNEGKGVSRLLKKSCDELISIPMRGNAESLNVSVSAALAVYKVLEIKEMLG